MSCSGPVVLTKFLPVHWVSLECSTLGPGDTPLSVKEKINLNLNQPDQDVGIFRGTTRASRTLFRRFLHSTSIHYLSLAQDYKTSSGTRVNTDFREMGTCKSKILGYFTEKNTNSVR